MKTVVSIMVGLLICAGVAAAEESGVEVSDLQVIQISKSPNFTTYSLKADVENRGDEGKVFVHVLAKNREGFQINERFFTGDFMVGERRTLTTTSVVSNEIAANIDQWNIDTIKKFPK